MSKHFIEHIPEIGVTEYLHLDGTGKAVLESIQDCEDIIEQNAYEAQFLDKKKDWWKVGNIPLSLCFKWAKESNTRPFSRAWQEYTKKKLQDPDYAKLNVNRIRL